MSFGEIFSKSWKEYKSNFREIFKFMFVFIVIPAIIFLIINLFWTFSNPVIYQSISSNEKGSLPLSFFAFTIIVSVISIILYLFVSAALTSISIKKSKFNFKELMQFGKNNLLIYIGFVIVSMLFIFGLLLLLIIPGIIFAFYWIFGSYALFDEKKGILKSLKRSKEIVKGRWWGVFGYTVLFFLIYLLVVIVSLLIQFPLWIMQIFNVLNNIPPSPGFFAVSSITETLISAATQIVMVPLMILFFKNFYFDLKRRKK